jgi:hypothetical protein
MSMKHDSGVVCERSVKIKDARTRIGSAEARVAAGNDDKPLNLELKKLRRKSTHLSRLMGGVLLLCNKMDFDTAPSRQRMRRNP